MRSRKANESEPSDDASIGDMTSKPGATLKRPELFRLLEIAQRGDVLLVEQVDRISRLNGEDWKLLKSQITGKGIIIIA